VRVGGMRICLQRPPTAKGFAFISLEDETGISNLVLAPGVAEQFRKEVYGALFLVGEGTLERTGKVLNIRVQRLMTLGIEEEQERPAPGAQGAHR
ncbi:MAG: hypothetical protein L0Y66_21845, partial [Myxococcaceae bacterium]|nr:hypothetical protein [Myxococcaceae bacterium]